MNFFRKRFFCFNESIIFGYNVKDPERYGVVSFNSKLEVKSIDEKPRKPKSKIAVVGLYFFKNDVINFAKQCIPSNRGELEITHIHNQYLDQKRLNIKNDLKDTFSRSLK